MQSLSAVWKLFFTNYFSKNDTIFICITAGLQDYYAYRQGKFSVKSPEKSNYIIGQLSNKRRQLKYNFKKPETWAIFFNKSDESEKKFEQKKIMFTHKYHLTNIA